MTDELRSTLRGGVNAIDARASEIVRSSTGENMISRLGTADWLSLGALFWAWAGAILFVSNEPNWAIMAVLAGFVFDKADGYYARKTGSTSAFGRQIDSFIDIFTYLVSAALLYHIALAPNAVVSAVVGFVVLAFGGLRLIRHNSEGFGDESGTSYYHGTTVVHTHLVVLANYFVFQFVPMWNGWVAGATIVAVCPLMTSDYKAYKTDTGHVLVGVAGAIAVAGCLALEFGVL